LGARPIDATFRTALIEERRRVEPRPIGGLVAYVDGDAGDDRVDLAGDLGERPLGCRPPDPVGPDVPEANESAVARVFCLCLCLCLCLWTA
jgi:hypothetical protein